MALSAGEPSRFVLALPAASFDAVCGPDPKSGASANSATFALWLTKLLLKTVCRPVTESRRTERGCAFASEVNLIGVDKFCTASYGPRFGQELELARS